MPAIEVINALARTVAMYGHSIINWTINEIRKEDGKIRKLLTMNCMHHPNGNLDRLYLPREHGGRELCQLEMSFRCNNVWVLKLVL